MSLRVIVSLASLLFFAGFAAAGISAPTCDSSWKWSANSLGQNPCTVAAYLISTCYGGSYTIDALPNGTAYTTSQNNNLCVCNTVAYSLLSACDGCQGDVWVPYSQYTANCTNVVAAGGFPNPVPSGTSVPLWALAVEANWDPIEAAIIGDTPEAGPGTKIVSA
ncbi:hypothetical protein V8E52_004550 [Russula decolorans]